MYSLGNSWGGESGPFWGYSSTTVAKRCQESCKRVRVTMSSRVEKHESSGSALGVLLECSESFMRALRVYLGLYLIFQANLADCMRYSLRTERVS